jgi:hypothetical protein
MNWDAEFSRASRQLASYPVAKDPFEFFMVRDFFSPELYQQMIANLPEDAAYEPRRTGDMNEAQRGFLHLDRTSIANLPPAQHAFWLAVRTGMLSQTFANQLMHKFGPEVAKRLAHDPSSSQLGIELKLVRDKENYALKPHTDAPSRMITLMIYLPKDESIKDYGTAIYRPKTPGFTCSGKNRYPFEDFTLVAKAPFLPNAGLGFFKSDTSFHGVELVAGDAVQRDMLMLQIRSTNISLLRRVKSMLRSEARGEGAWPLKKPSRAELVN